MNKIAVTKHPIQSALGDRWSPYAFADSPVSDDDLRSLFEAARWAASAFNEQPWRYLVARKSDGEVYDQVLSCLVEANQAWAQAAPVLVLTVVAESYARNGKPNGSAEHDVGLAAGNMAAEATARGLRIHQMGGILPDRARELFDIPEGFRAVTATAIGYAADPAGLPEDVRARETAPRERRPLAETVFTGTWERPADLLA
jgi:nitroreductase